MFHKQFSYSVIWLSNVLNRGRLFSYLREIRNKNNSDLPTDRDALDKYLKCWGFDKPIAEFPLMSKEDIRNNSRQIDLKKVYKISYTGGSTGEPLKTYYSKKRALIRTASLLYHNQLAGYRLGDSYLLTRSKDDAVLMKVLKNASIFVPNDLSDEKIESILHLIKRKRIKVLIGYPSVMVAFAVFLKKNDALKQGLKVKAIITSAEPIDKERQQFIKEAFNCTLLDRYANEENGILAHQRTFGGNYIVDRYNFFIEVLDPVSLKPAKAGEVGKVVVTDIASDLIPIIRYDTGDLAEVAEIKNDQVYSIRKIIGRVIDDFTKTSGQHFSPLTLGPHIRLPLSNLGIHFQFQFAQISANAYTLRLKVENNAVPAKNQQQIITGLKSVLGAEAVISIEYVTGLIARPSGKRPLYVNERTDLI